MQMNCKMSYLWEWKCFDGVTSSCQHILEIREIMVSSLAGFQVKLSLDLLNKVEVKDNKYLIQFIHYYSVKNWFLSDDFFEFWKKLFTF